MVCAVPLESEKENECERRDREEEVVVRNAFVLSSSPPLSRSTLLLASRAAPRRVAPSPEPGVPLFCLCSCSRRGVHARGEREERGGGGGARADARYPSRLQRGILYYDDQ